VLLIIEALTVNDRAPSSENAKVNEERVMSNRRRLFTRLERVDGDRNARGKSVAGAGFRMRHQRHPAAIARRRQTGEPFDLRLNHLLFADYRRYEFPPVLFAQGQAIRIRRARAIYEFEALFLHHISPPKIPGSAGIPACGLRSVGYWRKPAGRDACAP